MAPRSLALLWLHALRERVMRERAAAADAEVDVDHSLVGIDFGM